MELEEWIKNMEKTSTLIEVPEEKRVNIGTFYLTRKADFWWNTVRDRLVGPKLTWSKLLEKLRAKFYPIMVQCPKEKEFSELK